MAAGCCAQRHWAQSPSLFYISDWRVDLPGGAARRAEGDTGRSAERPAGVGVSGSRNCADRWPTIADAGAAGACERSELRGRRPLYPVATQPCDRVT